MNYPKNLSNLQHITVPIQGGGSVYVLDKGEVINSEAEAMLQALHSRSTGGLMHHLQILEEKGADDFMSKFYVGYGHKSIGDCGSATLFIEGISMLAAKAIQDTKLYNGQEASTRYIDFSKQTFINPLGTDIGNAILEKQRSMYLTLLEPIKEDLKNKNPIEEGQKQSVYEKAIAAKAFDIARGFLPAGASTNLARHSNLRQIADRINFLRYHPLEEVRNIAQAVQDAVLKKYPNSFSTKTYEDTENYTKSFMEDYYYHNPNYDNTITMTDRTNKKQFEKYKHIFDSRPNGKTELPQFLHSTGELDFEFQLDFGSFRDIQRHRALNQRMPLLTTELGFHPRYIKNLPTEIQESTQQYLSELEKEISELKAGEYTSQYYIPMGYLTSNYFSGTLPATIYMTELRATRFVHPTLREIAGQIALSIQKEFDIPLFIDSTPEKFDVKRGEHDIVIK